MQNSVRAFPKVYTTSECVRNGINEFFVLILRVRRHRLTGCPVRTALTKHRKNAHHHKPELIIMNVDIVWYTLGQPHADRKRLNNM